MGLALRKATAVDRRKAPRRPLGLIGKLIFDGVLLDCTIIDLSDGGARIELAADVILPASFYLRIPIDQPIAQACLVWRSHRTIGVQFVARWTRATDVPDPAIRAALG